MGNRRDGEAGSSSVMAFMVAGAVFIGAVGAVLFVTSGAGGDPEPVDYAGHEAMAQSLADLLTASPGLEWEDGPDSVGRLGLLLDNRSGLDVNKLDALRGALKDADATNGKVDYAEAVASLGMDGDFHIRMYPIGLEPTLLQADLSGIRTGYIGDWGATGTITVTLASREEMLAEAQAELDLKMLGLTFEERDALTSLGLGFTDSVYLALSLPDIRVDLPLVDVPLLQYLGETSVEGDVYPDQKQYIDGVLAGRLSQYDLLVVGTGVDQNSLTSTVTKNAIRDYVLGGGMLFVFGSDKQNFQWLQPLFSLGTSTVNGAAFAPDVTHPVLHEPQSLSWTAYDNHGQAWDIKDLGSGARYDDFSHVVVSDGDDVLAISNPGAFGDGRVFLSTYRPSEIAQQIGQEEAQALFLNFILFCDRSHLYLDYGATVPAGVSVAAAVRETYVWDEALGQVPIRVEIHYWEA